jgi:hypothetical protein
MNTEWPPEGKRREDDRAWFGTIRRYEGAILLGLIAVMFFGSVFAWIDRRDNVAVFERLRQAITDLSVQAGRTAETLSRVEASSGILTTQNAKWVSLERELAQLRQIADSQQEIDVNLTARVQRIEDQRDTEKELRK